jgi:hypothetical protein
MDWNIIFNVIAFIFGKALHGHSHILTMSQIVCFLKAWPPSRARVRDPAPFPLHELPRHDYIFRLGLQFFAWKAIFSSETPGRDSQ